MAGGEKNSSLSSLLPNLSREKSKILGKNENF
jgi:hypothetical protein